MLTMEERLQLLQLSDEEFAEGIAAMVKSLMLGKEESEFANSKVDTIFTGDRASSTESFVTSLTLE